MKITKLYIDGYKNVVDTSLDFSLGPIIILLAPNNYGKSNLLSGIRDGFKFLRKNGTVAVKYVQGKSYVNYNRNKDHQRFTFEVEFEKRRDAGKCYLYRFVLDPTETDHSVKYLDKYPRFDYSYYTSDVAGIVEEELVLIEGSNKRVLFERDTNDPNIAYLGEDKANPYVINSADTDVKGGYPHTFYLFLHRFGNMALAKNADDKECNLLLDEIHGVLTSLTRESIGMVLAGEDDEFRAPALLVQDVRKMHDAEYTFLIGRFIHMFHQYESVRFERLGTSGQLQCLLKRKSDDREETTSTLSYGTRRVLKLLSQVFANTVPLISIEELESGLHPTLYRDVLNSFLNCLDIEAYNKRNMSIPEKDHRRNDPKVIISSHAPGMINEFDDHLGAVYIGRASKGQLGLAQFSRLNPEGIKGVEDMRREFKGMLGVGDIIFQLFFDEYAKLKIEEEWLDFSDSHKGGVSE
ncbi:MAG: AAA family ATPase [Candidatus Bathyarchaeota archaeon]|nr:AAA family ATPase [Candidatus Termiticorpusculum sp.]